MGTTTKGLPYPEDTGRVMDGAGAVEALALAVDARLPAKLTGAQNPLTGAGKPPDQAVTVIAGTTVVGSNASGDVSVTFDTPFPNGVLCVVAGPGDTAPGARTLTPWSYTLTGFAAKAENGAGAVMANQNIRVNYIAVGW